jgi:2-polyprenyl-3-methyl-5-hydroxy-6-metoxy-1,4-benzoquinol methylase
VSLAAQVSVEAQIQNDCPLCRHGESRTTRVEGPYTLRRCLRCQFMYVVPRPTPEELKRMYSDEYFSGDNMDDATLQFREPVFQQCIATLQRLRPERGRLLDVGCWTGEFLNFARAVGWDPVGIELSTKAAAFARSKELPVHCTTLEAAPFPTDHFDVVTFLDVLEHLPEPAKELALARSLLKPGGIIVVRLPNTNFHLPKARLCRALKVADIGLQMRYHLNHFTPRTLAGILRSNGFEVLRVDVGAPELIAHAQWASPWAKRSYVRIAEMVKATTGFHVGNVVVMYARKLV